MSVACLEVAGQAAGLTPADSPVFQYLGAWQAENGSQFTIYPGSQMRFGLKGRASLAFQAGCSESILAMVRKNGEIVWRGILGQDNIEVDGGEAGASFSVVYLASSHTGFDPAAPGAKAAELRFHGAQLGEDGAWAAPPGIEDGPLVEFIGDSITEGAHISARSEWWSADSDASLTYAFQLAERLQGRYRIRAFRGDGYVELAGKFPFFRKEVPLLPEDRPDIVFANIGANERLKNDVEYRLDARRLLDAIFKTSPDARVILMNFHRMTPNRLPVLKELANSYPVGSVLCFDARTYLTGYSDSGVHPDPESHRRLADALLAFVQHNSLLAAQSAGEMSPACQSALVSP